MQWVHAFAVALFASHLSGALAAETNHWTKLTDGNWHELAWSLAKLPDASQFIEITNARPKSVTIDAATAENHPSSLTIQNLLVTGENTLLLDAGRNHSLVIDPGTNVGAGVALSWGGTLMNHGMILDVGGENPGLLRINGGKLFQDDGSVIATTTYIYGGGEYHLTKGLLDSRYLTFPTSGGSFFQYGGTVYTESVQVDLSSYSLQGGELHVRSSLRLRDNGSVAQWGGTNRVPELIVAANSSGGARYLLTDGLLCSSNVLVGAFMMSSEIIQNGGEHTITNKLTVSGSARYYPPVPIPARYALTNGHLSARELELRGIGGFSEFIVAGGSARFAEKIQLNVSDAEGIGGIRGLVKLENGTLSTTDVLHDGVGADIIQTGGALVVSNLFSFGGFVPPPYNYGSPPRKKALYDFSGGTFSAHDIELLGEWNIGSSTLDGRITNPGSFNMAGTLRVGDAREQLGRFVLTSNAVIDLGPGHANLAFADSNSEEWNPEAMLIITNWSGSRTGNGEDQLRFGANGSSLTSQQLNQIHFVDPAGDTPGTYSAEILFTGEIVPTAPITSPAFTITAPISESSFLAPATVEMTGEVRLPEGDWFVLRVFKLPTIGGAKRRTDVVHIATLQTNRFSLILTNLPADRYEYGFTLGTLSDPNAASNTVSFSVTNFPYRLGPYSVTDLGTLGGTQSMALAINNRGQAVGQARNGNDRDRAVLFENGTVHDLGTLGGAASRAYGINNNGDIVGSAETAAGLSVPFVYRDGQMVDLGFTEAGDALDLNDRGDIVGNTPNGGFAILDGVKSALWFRVFDINNRRQVAGEAIGPIIEDLEIHPPFVDDPTENGYIAAKIYGHGSAYAINETRQFTGLVEDGNYREYRVFAPLYSQGNLQILTSGFAKYSAGLGINRWGEVVGSYLPRWTGTHLGRPSTDPPTQAELQDKEAFIANPKGVANLNTLIPSDSGWLLLEATDINDSGQIVGFGLKDGEVRAFRLDPLLALASLQRAGDHTSGMLHATPGATIHIEATTDFQSWRPVATETTSGFEIPFTDHSTDTALFYRAVLPAP